MMEKKKKRGSPGGGEGGEGGKVAFCVLQVPSHPHFLLIEENCFHLLGSLF